MEANGIPIMALVDSGSTISMIHPSVLDRIQRGYDVLDRIQQGHDVTLVGDMGHLRVEDGRAVETHGVVQLSLRVGTDPSRWWYTCRRHGTTARCRRQNSGNPWGSTTEFESWYGPFSSIAWDGGRRDGRASHNANVLILWWWIIAYLMPLVGPSSSMVGPTIAGSSRECSKHHMPASCEAISYILAIHSKSGNVVMGWQPRSNKFLVCVDDVLTQTLCYSHSCPTWKLWGYVYLAVVAQMPTGPSVPVSVGWM